MIWDETSSAPPQEMESIIKAFAKIATTGKGSNLCLQEGFLPVPVHFYSPIPDLNDLEQRRIWDKRSELKGIDFRPEAQIALLKELGQSFGHECAWPPANTGNPVDFFTENDCFSYGCAASTHCLIRKYKPNLVIEIGSGMSSRVISKALGINKSTDPSRRPRYSIIDPYPSHFIKRELSEVEVMTTRVELLDPAFFDQLQANDILFIDSGHSVRIGSDVNSLFLEILPRLAPGVLVHIHDIHMPYEYHKVYATKESFRQFWTEQYLLQAFLSFNEQFEVLLGMYYLMKDQLETFRQAFPSYDPSKHLLMGASFWIRRKL